MQKNHAICALDEFLSGFYREGRLIPVITLVIYFQPTPWDGPRTLYEMFGEQPPEMMKYVSDYRMHLIEPAALSEDELSRFHSELGTVLKFLKHANEKMCSRSLLCTCFCG